jgi:hypothetical protein
LIIITQIEKIGESHIENQRSLTKVVETTVIALIVKEIDYGLTKKGE